MFIKVGTLPSCAASTTSDLEFEGSTVVFLLNFGGILQKKVCPTRSAKNMFQLDFGPKHTKSWELVNA